MSNPIHSLTESVRLKRRFFAEHHDAILAQAVILAAALRGGGKLIAFGNGGSAADAGRAVSVLNRRGYPGVSLPLYATLESLPFADLYRVQRRKGDCALAISTSGNSQNVLDAVRVAQELGDPVIALTGQSGGRLLGMLPTALVVDSTSTQRIQEVHLMLVHELCAVTFSLLQ